MGLDPDTREWVASTPGVRNLLRTRKQPGLHPLGILLTTEKIVGRPGGGKGRKARQK
jgi:hypothetical protein